MLGNFSMQAQFYKDLASIDSSLGHLGSAYAYFQQFHHLSDSLRRVKESEAIDNIKLEFELAIILKKGPWPA